MGRGANQTVLPNPQSIFRVLLIVSKTKIISFINYKGGVAKTTSTYHIGCWLAEGKGKNVLLIDIDPQANLTFLCVSVDRWQERRSETGTIIDMYERFLDTKPLNAERYVWKTPICIQPEQYLPKIDLIPCDIDLIGKDVGSGKITGAYPSMETLKKSAEQFLQDRSFLAQAIDEIKNDYDYILIDCPPNLSLMTQNALLASDYYAITAIPDHLSTIGLNTLIKKSEEIGELVTHAAALTRQERRKYRFAEFGAALFVKVRIGGTRVTNAHEDKMDEVMGMLGKDKCFKTYTTELIGYTEAAENSLPVWHHSSDNARRANEKQEYPKITNEFMDKFPS